MSRLTSLDLAIVIGYNLAIVALGCGFWRRAQSSEKYMAGNRALPGWALGLSIFGSYVSSISFLANPGKAYDSNWNYFVFALSMPLAAWIAARWFVPFYRRSGNVSAYEHLEHRFGRWARTYAVVCFLLLQVWRLGTILYLLGVALEPLLGWNLPAIIAVTGAVIVIYPLFGGAEAWIWTGVMQAIWLLGGAAVCVAAVLAGMPEGAGQVFRIASSESKFAVGSFGGSLAESTFWVVLVNGLVTHLQNFGIDQSYVQRYITSKSDRGAVRSIWMGTWMFIPVSAAFFFIGTALFAFYRAQPGLLPAELAAKPDGVFPHFIGTQLASGVAGIVIAAIAAAAMDSNLTCSATLFYQDIYRRYLRPRASERESMWTLRLSTLGFGAASMAASLAMIQVKTALDAWWQIAGIVSGGILGLFLLGLSCRRAGNRAALLGVASGVIVILWMTFSPSWEALPPSLRSPFDKLLVPVIGTTTILIVGALAAVILPRERSVSPHELPMKSLDVHLANDAERAQAFRNLHDVWGRGLSAEEHLRWRLGFAKHRNASWYVGCLDGRVVAGCGAYNFRLHVDGAIREACVFGEVHTLAEFRGQGFAPTLLAAAEEDQRRRGKTIAMLYSDIAPAYYERLGYVVCPSLEGWANQLGTSAAPPSALTPPLELQGCDPLQELDALVALYDSHHASLPLAVARSRAYWGYLVARSPSDEHFWLGAGGERLGYVRLIVTPVEAKIRDVAFAREDETLAAELYAAVLRLARARGLERAGGWMPDTPAAQAHFQLAPRRTEITMLKPLVPTATIAPRHCEAAARFHEIDHV